MNKNRKNSILIVDDENSNILTLTHILNSDYNVYAAKDGLKAIQAANKYLPDIILLDIIMSEMDGYAVLAELKSSEKTQNIPVIFITGLSDVADEEKGLALGVADYITKPFSAAIVKLRVRNQMQMIEQFRSNEYDIMKYKLSNDALKIGLWDMDVENDDPSDSNYKFTWSQEFRQMLGFDSEDDFPNMLDSWSRQIHPEDKEKALDDLAAHIIDYSGNTPYDIECRIMLKTGEYRNFRALGTTHRGIQGQPIRTAGALMDITERKRMEREIEETMAKIEEDAHWYKSILDAIPLPVSVTDAAMNWTFANKAVEVFLDKKREDIYGQPCSNWMSGICNTDECGAACAKRGEKRTFFNHHDSSYQVDVEILHDLMGEISGFIEVVQDITNVKQLAKQQAESEMTSRAKSAFLANMSHEIRTPMNAILGITEILLQNENLPDKTLEGLDKIRRSCDLLIGIINDILDFSKIEAGKIDIIPAQYSIASLINDAIHLNMMRMGNKPIEFEIQVDENIPAKLIGDELRIKQILNNLLSNAFKYTDKGKVSLLATTGPTTEGVTLVFAIIDTGRGLTSEQISKLFDEYSRFNEEHTRTIEGTGLGLAITNRLLELMDGKIYVESEPGKGSKFIIRLPQGTVDEEVLGKDMVENLQQFRVGRYMANEKRAKVIRDPMPYGKVLVVDDVETNHYVVDGLLKPYGLHLESVMSGLEAIEQIKSGKVYDIVFMDHMMPVMDGMEATKQIRDLGYTAPIVALTANAVVGQADIFLQNGFDDFISKPIDIYNLNSVLNIFIRDKQPPEVIEAARKQMGATEADNKDSNAEMSSLLKESFIKDANKAVKTLEDICQGEADITDKDLKNFTISVHGMKSSLRNIGELELSELAYNLEQAGKEQNTAQIKESTPEFINKLRGLLDKFKPEQEAGGTDDIAYLQKQLLSIQEMCADYDRKGVLDILAEMENCSNESKVILNTIMEYVQHSDFEKAEKEASDFAAYLAGKE
ncbi:MAG: response regulator [Treponema sp.]|jgi:PAS domain S-box-containing protein|nr:response regulator [Treponema sp.]